jgi:DNA-binding CsgD family transcriptional regulator
VESIRQSSYLWAGVQTLSARDAKQVLRFVAEAAQIGGDDAFTVDVVAELRKLVPADGVAYCEQDRVRQRLRHLVGVPDDDDGAAAEVSYWEIAAEHPVCRRHSAGDSRALKLSDFMTLAQLRRSRLYALWFRPVGIVHELNMPIPSPLWHTKTFLFDRGSGRDFTERDRCVLEALQPHLANLWLAAQARRRLSAAMEAVEEGAEQDVRGVVLLGRAGEVELVSAPARRLIGAYFGWPKEGELPPAVANWLGSPAAALVLQRGRNRLTIERAGDRALVLTETPDELGLTAREQQILAWVARGKTNPEIAEILWVAPSTVRKHLENVYAKLGVRTRTAAAARFLGVLDGDGRAG